jgi:hypothetical protein
MKYFGLQKRLFPSAQVSSFTTGSIVLPSAKSTFIEMTPPVSGYNRWYDASDLSSMTISSGNVSQWNDKSGNNYHISNATGGSQPNILLNYKNGRHAVQFIDSNADNLKSTNQPTTGNSSGTIFFVGRTDSYTADQCAVSWGTSNAVGAGISLIFTGQSSGVSPNNWAWGYAGDLTGNYSYGQAKNVNEWVVLSGTFSGTSLATAVNVTNTATKTSASSNISNNSEFFLGVLTNPWYETFGYNGIICEVLIYTSVLNSTQITDITNWLKKKWAI